MMMNLAVNKTVFASALISALFTLQACQPSTDAAPETSAAEPQPESTVETTTEAETVPLPEFVDWPYQVSGASLKGHLLLPETYSATLSGDGMDIGTSEPGTPRPGGRLQDVAAFRLPESVEAALSGQDAVFSIESAGGAFKTAHSTAEVGNSGWRNFEASVDPELRTFGWAVPEMNNGNGDYLGIAPTSDEPVTIVSISIDLASEAIESAQ
ncbi:MAG: hypothetical protein AAF829_05325 [Pseudomonadota bacterium]